MNQSIRVSDGCADQFSADETSLSVLLDMVGSAEYVVTDRSRRVMDAMLNGICADGSLFKGFHETIEPLCRLSPNLREVSSVADNLANRTKEESLDLARALLLPLPNSEDTRVRSSNHEN